MDRGAWRVTWGRVHGVTKGQTQQNRLSMHALVLSFPVPSPLGCTVGVTAGTGSPFASILSPLGAHHWGSCLLVWQATVFIHHS